MRTHQIGRGLLAGSTVGVLATIALWASVIALVATVPRDLSGVAVVGALGLGPALLVCASVLGTVLGCVAALVAPVLGRGGLLRAAVVAVLALVAFCCWGYLFAVVPSRWLTVLPGPGYNTAVLVVTAVGALVGTAATLTVAVRPVRRPGPRSVGLVVVTAVVGAVVGLLGWWIRRGFPSWASGLPSPTEFVGSGFASDVDLDQDWVWGATTGLVLAVVVVTVALWCRRPVLVVPLAAVTAGAAAFVSATTGVVFPVLRVFPLTEFPSATSYASSTAVLPPSAIAVTTAVWAASGALAAWSALAITRRSRRTRPVARPEAD